MAFAPGRWTLTPALGVVQINTTTDTETTQVFLPAAGVGGTYTFNDDWAVFASVYGTRLKADVDTTQLSGELTLGLGVTALGVAYNIYGCERNSDFRMVAVAGLMAGRLSADLGIGRAKRRLYMLDVSAAVTALQAEWRPWAYLSFVPHITGWRLLAVKQTVGNDERNFPVPNRWQASTGLDVWFYPSPSADSHLSLGMLFSFGGDKPVSSFSLSWTFVFGDDGTQTDAGEDAVNDVVEEPAVESGELDSQP